MALATVTDEFIKYIRNLQQLGEEWALDEASEFLVIAATLLDLKAARLLPAGEVEDDEDIALLEARDLLFARLLQYKAFKQVAGLMDATLELEARQLSRARWPWRGTSPPCCRNWCGGTRPEQFAALAEAALKPKDAAPTEVGLAHLHGSTVSVKEQAEILGLRLQQGRPLSFRALIADAESTLVVVARFLALLEMFRDKVVAFDQLLPLADLTVHWTAGGRRLEQRQSERRIRGAAVSTTHRNRPRRAGGRRTDVADLPGGARAALEAVLMVHRPAGHRHGAGRRA